MCTEEISSKQPTLEGGINAKREAFRCHLEMMLAGVLDVPSRAYLLAAYRTARAEARTPDWQTWWADRLARIEPDDEPESLGPAMETLLDTWPIPTPLHRRLGHHGGLGRGATLRRLQAVRLQPARGHP